MKRILFIKLTLIVFIITLLMMYAPCAYTGIWTPMISGTTQGLRSIWGSSATDVFTVGENGTILHYNGSIWSAIASGTTNNLYGVWGSSGSDVYAVGGNGTILHLKLCAAESIYGEHVAETELLRAYRDNVLSKTPEGQEVIKIYYKFSPIVIELLERNPVLNNRAKALIDSILPGIRINIADSNDKQ